jgi:WD40 repeat protein
MFKRMKLFLVAVGILVIGSGLLAQNRGQEQKPEKRIRTDLYGDPLPQGAVARLGTLRFRAPAEITALAYAANGKTIAISTNTGLFLFDAISGKKLRHLAGFEFIAGWGNLLVFSPDGKRLAASGAIASAKEAKGMGSPIKETVFIWDLPAEGKPKQYDADQLRWLGWSTAGEPLAVCVEKGGLRLHELAVGKSKFFPCRDLLRSGLCDHAPAGRTLAVVEQYIVHVWDTANGRERCTVKPKNVGFFRSLALSPDGRILACVVAEQGQTDRNTVQLWDCTDGKTLRTLGTDQKYVFTLAFSPDGKTLATAGWHGIRFWDVTTGKERSRCQGPGSNTMAKAAFSGNGQTLATVETYSGAFHLWEVVTGKRKPEPSGHANRPSGAAFSPDGKHLATGGGLDGIIHLWDLATGESVRHIYRNRWVRDIAFSLDGRSLYSAWADDNLWISDPDTGEKKHVLKLQDPDRPDTYQSAISMHRSADGKTLVAVSYYYPRKNVKGPEDTLITGWDTTTHKQLFRRTRPGRDSWLAVSADALVLAAPDPGSRLASEFGRQVQGVGPMRLEEIATGAELLTFPVLEEQTWSLAFSPDGRLLASNTSDYKRRKEGDPTGSNLRLWETATATEVLSLPGGGQHRVAFSQDGRLLAMTAPLQEILVYNLAAGREVRRFKHIGAEVTCLTFSPDGRRLVSGLADSTLLIWDVATPALEKKSKLGAEAAAQAWTDLAGKDAPRAFRARWALVAAPETAVPLLQKRLQPVQPADSKRLRRLIANLDDKRFPVRQEAQRELEEIGELAAPALKQALAKKPSLELRQRIDRLLSKLGGPVTRPEMVRGVRAVAVLEDVATPQARKLLQTLSQGAPEARLTQEAKAALTRLAKPSG